MIKAHISTTQKKSQEENESGCNLLLRFNSIFFFLLINKYCKLNGCFAKIVNNVGFIKDVWFR